MFKFKYHEMMGQQSYLELVWHIKGSKNTGLGLQTLQLSLFPVAHSVSLLSV